MASINAQFEEEREVVASEHLQHAMMEMLYADMMPRRRRSCVSGASRAARENDSAGPPPVEMPEAFEHGSGGI